MGFRKLPTIEEEIYELRINVRNISQRLDKIEAIGKNKNSATESELLPCPFCGSHFVKLVPHNMYPHMTMAKCRGCAAQSTGWIKKEGAVGSWNRRA